MTEENDKTLIKMKMCGCRKDILDVYKNFNKIDKKTDAIQLFEKYREELQEVIDKQYKSIDCVDYLIYEIERSKGEIHDG